jgi:hypothetical protein
MAGARYDYYEPNADALDLAGGVTVLAQSPFKTVTLTAAAKLEPIAGVRARAIGEYAFQENGLGRDAAGRRTTLDNHVARLRLEVSF